MPLVPVLFREATQLKTVGAVACDDVEVLRAEMHAYSIVAADGRRIIESIVSDADQGSASSVDPRVAEARGAIWLFVGVLLVDIFNIKTLVFFFFDFCGGF
ncbi:hypothetical protein [uncultured Rikenella sp.]|uniref:hypothetical protein n=1 Tax=uncultured Rikenella sp. TaxID=368003 RepID=UPI00272A2A79|nr:hypothetical protein [uncultured Rikenella sp.]